MEIKDLIIPVTGIITIAALEITAMVTGNDGTTLSAAIGAIGVIVGGVAGYTIAEMKKEIV